MKIIIIIIIISLRIKISTTAVATTPLLVVVVVVVAMIIIHDDTTFGAHPRHVLVFLLCGYQTKFKPTEWHFLSSYLSHSILYVRNLWAIYIAMASVITN